MKKQQNTKGSKAFVRVVNPLATYQVSVAVTIAVDTSYVISQGGVNVTTGVYMFDNQLNHGSTGEGTLELTSNVNSGAFIGFEVVPIDPNTGDTVAITGFNVSQGNVFGGQGYPIQQQPNYWIGQAVNAGQQTYQIQIKVTSGGLRPTNIYVTWDPYIKAQ